MKKDHFPRTETWVGRRVARGDLDEVKQHVMEIYNVPLMIYFKGHSLHWLDEPQDMISDFFAHSLSSSEFFEKWQASGRRLGQWLRGALYWHLKSRLKARKTEHDRRPGPLPPDDALFAENDTHALDLERNAVLALAHKTTTRAEELCRADGLSQHWEVFRRHHLLGEKLKDFAEELGISSDRASVMNRTAQNRLREAAIEILKKEMLPGEKLEEVVENLLEVLKS